MGRLDLPDPVRDEDVYVGPDTNAADWQVQPEEEEHVEPCTCTLACIPQGITEEQTCRMQLDPWPGVDEPDAHDCPTAHHLRSCGFCRAVYCAPHSDELRRIITTLDTLFDGRAMTPDLFAAQREWREGR